MDLVTMKKEKFEEICTALISMDVGEGATKLLNDSVELWDKKEIETEIEKLKEQRQNTVVLEEVTD